MSINAAKRVLILVHERPENPKNRNWYPFRDTIQKYLDTDNIAVDIESLQDLVYVNDGKRLRIYNPLAGTDLSLYDLVMFRTVRDQRTRASCCVQLLRLHEIPYIDAMYRPGAYSKVSSDFRRTAHSLPVIPSIFTSAAQYRQLFSDDSPLGYPFIFKDIQGRKGGGNYLVKSYEQLCQILNEHPLLEFVAQKFIPNDGDYRCLIMGSKIRVVFHRSAVEGNHLNNTSQGGVSRLVDLSEISPEVQEDMIKAAHLDQIDLAGVDLIFDKVTNDHYIMEVNSSPQLTTGGFPEQKVSAFADYLKELLQQ